MCINSSFKFISATIFTAAALFCAGREKIVYYSHHQNVNNNNFDWLIGAWQMQLKNGILYEIWERKDNLYQNKSYKVSAAGDTVMLETVQILEKDGNIYYTPTTFDQNDQKPVYFRMTEMNENSFVAENPEHDFPQKITYRLRNNNELYAMIDGKIKEQYRREEFLFIRQTDDLQSLVAAENNFALASKQKSIEEAFRANLGDSSIVFVKGNPVNGKEFWKDKPVSDGYLFWWPVVADIAASGELGYTTGPCELGKDKHDPQPAGGGYYATVWKKDKNGQWKIAVDLGSGKFDPTDSGLKLKTGSKPSQNLPEKIDPQKEKEMLLLLDKNYNAKLNEEKRSFFISWLSPAARLHRGGERPFTTLDEIRANIKIEEGVKFHFEQSGGGVSDSGDLAYTFGKSSFELMQDGKLQKAETNYLRVWKKEDGKEWKIVLDVVGG